MKSKRPSRLAVGIFGVLMGMLALSLLYTLWVSFQEAPGQWAGEKHYRALFEAEGARLIGNSLLLTAPAFFLSLLLGGPLSRLVPRLRSHAARGAALCALLLPAFVPPVCWAAGGLSLLNGGNLSARLAYWLAAGVSGAGIVGFAGAACALSWPGRGFWYGMGWAALLWLFTSLSPLAELPALWAGAPALETMDARLFATVSASPSAAAAAYAVRAGLSLALGAAVCLGVYGVFFRVPARSVDTIAREPFPFSLGLWLLPVGALSLLLCVLFRPRLGFLGYGDALLKHLPGQLAAAALTGLSAFALAWALVTVLGSRGRRAFTLCAGLLLSLGLPVAAVYRLLEALGLQGSILSVVLGALFSPSYLLLTLLCVRLAASPRALGRRPWWPLAALPACLAMAQAWGGVGMGALLGTPAAFPWGALLADQLQSGLGMDLVTFLLVLVPALLLGVAGSLLLSRALSAE